ncbi:hypothetical protein FBALC1_00827 [Flavobacteriales bacterium ALC-1]|nr:hypothetical protein FBALC1_00827 [Flavobacteriales bacterium ALC-1]
MAKNISFLLFFLSIASFSQEPSVIMPDLDTGKNPFIIKFSEDPENDRILSSYVEGETETDSLFLKAKILPVLERVMVTILLKNKSENVKIDIVKKHWKDIKRSGETQNGALQLSFDTAEEFGIILSSNKAKVKFNMAIWRSGKIVRETNLFYAANTSSPATNSTAAVEDNAQEDSVIDVPENEKPYMFLVVGLLVIVVILLILILKKKSSKTLSLFIVFLFHHGITQANVKPSNVGRYMEQLKNLDKAVDIITKIDDYANILDALRHGVFDNFLDETDIEASPKLDPAGQPTLPSSCLADYKKISQNNGSESNDSNTENMGKESQTDTDTESDQANDNQSGSSNSSMETTNKQADAASNDMTSISENSETLQLPTYDQNGTLINLGDFPNAPTKINPSTNSPDENPFIEGQVSDENTSRRQPKYDKNGGLIDYGDFPDAPLIIDVETGLPLMNPFIEGSDNPGKFVRHPKYDKDGNLIDNGDFPDAPKYVTPSSIKEKSNTPEESRSSGNQNSELEYKRNDQDKKQKRETKKKSESKDKNKSSDKKQKEEGCECLKKAYVDLEIRRYNLEQLRIIAARIDRYTDEKISYGDDVSSVHAVVGLKWQSVKKGILKSMNSFNGTYETKYRFMIEDLHKILLKIDKCEAQLGFENWYSNSGFIYYSFMKDRYKRN